MSYDEIMNLSRQQAAGGLDPWFDTRLRGQIQQGLFLPADQLEDVHRRLVGKLSDYRQQGGVGTAVLGMSGGVDSALTAALFKEAGWRVIGHTMPIHQNPEETERGVEACEALGLEHVHIDLTAEFEAMVAALAGLDPDLASSDEPAARTRRGNLRARLRMVTLYDQAHRHSGIVASTDNYSELGAGFWTLHGDVGDLAPVQGLLKSWEIPWMARAAGVPEKTWRAKPTDGLGIGAGDEAQIGATYLEWDIMVFALSQALERNPRLDVDGIADALDIDPDSQPAKVMQAVLYRLRTTWHKRVNPISFDNPLSERFPVLDRIDEDLFRPQVLVRNEARLDFPVDLQAAASDLSHSLRQRDLRLVTAESCTGGLLSASLAAVPGSGSSLEGSIVTYGTTMKTSVLGVSQEVVDECTVYDPEVARQMAAGALQAAPKADVALSITGVAGPDNDQGKPAGYVCIGACRRGKAPVAKEFNFDGGPQAVLAASMAAALQLGLSELEAGGT
ncbi:MAG: NAD(+) synthase [Pseudomonadota bacterium]|nr:NAD(+) synthase [Pseudomonadota bacterium]